MKTIKCPRCEILNELKKSKDTNIKYFCIGCGFTMTDNNVKKIQKENSIEWHRQQFLSSKLEYENKLQKISELQTEADKQLRELKIYRNQIHFAEHIKKEYFDRDKFKAKESW